MLLPCRSKLLIIARIGEFRSRGSLDRDRLLQVFYSTLPPPPRVTFRTGETPIRFVITVIGTLSAWATGATTTCATLYVIFRVYHNSRAPLIN